MTFSVDAFDQELIQQLVAVTTKKVLAYLRVKESNIKTEDIEPDIYRLLLDAMPDSDGYGLTRDLERMGWQGDTELVNILDNVCFDRNTIKEKLRSARIAAVGSKAPRYKIGDKVLYKHNFRSQYATVLDVIVPTLKYVLKTEIGAPVPKIIMGEEHLEPVGEESQIATP